MGVTPFPVEYSVPVDDNIFRVVHRLRLNRSGGLLVMQAEHLRKWLLEVTQEEATYSTHW